MQEHSYVEPLDGIDTSVCLYQFRGTGNAPDAGARYAGTIDWEFTPPAPADYRRSFDTVRRNLLGGNSYLTNLTCKVPLRTNLTLKDVFLHSHALYKLWLKDRVRLLLARNLRPHGRGQDKILPDERHD